MEINSNQKKENSPNPHFQTNARVSSVFKGMKRIGYFELSNRGSRYLANRYLGQTTCMAALSSSVMRRKYSLIMQGSQSFPLFHLNTR